MAGSGPAMTTQGVSASMRPLAHAGGFEIVRIGLDLARLQRRLLDPVGEALLLRVGDGFFLGGEAQAHLRLRVGRTRPAHQRLDLGRVGAVEFEQPEFRARAARLGGGFGGAVDPCRHGAIRIWAIRGEPGCGAASGDGVELYPQGASCNDYQRLRFAGAPGAWAFRGGM